MLKTLILTLIFSILACDLISEKGGHDILRKLEKELTNYNTKIKQEKIAYEKEKQTLRTNKPNNYKPPILSQGTKKHLEKQINESDKLKEKCKEIIQTTLKKIQDIEELHNRTLKLKEEADKIKKEFENSRYSNSNWSLDKKTKVGQLNQQIQDKISSAIYWPNETKQIYQSLKESIETTINNSISHTYHLEKDIKTGQIPEDWINRILDNNQSANEIMTKCEKILQESAKQSAETANKYVKELEKDVQEALNVINNTSY